MEWAECAMGGERQGSRLYNTQNERLSWLRAWVNAVDHAGTRWASAFHLSQNHGTGLLIQGSRDWRNYTVQSAIMSDPAKSFGIAARVQGLSRYYALLLGPNQSVTPDP